MEPEGGAMPFVILYKVWYAITHYADSPGEACQLALIGIIFLGGYLWLKRQRPS